MKPPDHDYQHRLEEVLAAYMQRIDRGEQVDREALVAEHPKLADELQAYFAGADQVERMAGPRLSETIDSDPARPTAVCPIDVVRYFGDYELLEEIARGGMGVVFKARQVTLNRLVALKMILAGQLASPTDVARFRQEAEAAANLDHPGIVPIFEIGEHEGQHYFSMKLIEGGSLRERMQASCFDQREAAKLMAAAARAVHHAHQRGVLHRDLKPGNVLIDADGQPHLTDFGLAKRVEGPSDLTQSGAVVGTPSYMAPEQSQGKKQLTTAVDVYSLGAILYELLTGRPPFRGESPAETLLAALSREPEAPRSINPTIDRDLEIICLKCLEKDPQRRYESAAALAGDLERWLADEPILARPDPFALRLARLLRRHRVWFQAGAASLSLILVGLIAALVLINSAKNDALEAKKTALELLAERTKLATEKSDLTAANFELAHKEADARSTVKQQAAVLNQDKAIQDYSEAIRLNPNDASAYSNRGGVWENKGDYDKAIQDYSEAIRLVPDYKAAFANRAAAWEKKGDCDKAIADLSEVIRLDPKNSEAYYRRGLAQVAKGRHDKKTPDYDRAIADYNEAIRLDSKNAEAYRTL